MDIKNIRTNYTRGKLDIESIHKNPFVQFESWLNEAVKFKVHEPTAMNLATSNKNGIISSRIVLLKDFSEKGFVFFTNYESLKGKQIQENPNAALNFFWPQLERQIRIEGIISKVSDNQSKEYFHSRPLESQINAIISPQSKEIVDKNELLRNKQYLLKNKKEVKRPNYWGGYLLKPIRIEFWQGGENRLNDRINYVLKENNWKIHRLAP